MKIIPFPKPLLPIEATTVALPRDPALDDIFWHLETTARMRIVFIDKSDFCIDYVAQNSWIELVASIVEVDQDILSFFKIDRVPTWIWFQRGAEQLRVTGIQSWKEIKRQTNNLKRRGRYE